MIDPAGDWALTIDTPIGTMPVTLRLAHEDGVLRGTASSRDETVPLDDLIAIPEGAGVRLTWRQSIRRPIRLNLSFDVLAGDDTLIGHARAGRLPRSTVRGTRNAGGGTAG